ncbi:MAG: hypothetical protein V2J12_06410 [Gammaproteobacteria bacterium]|nr:hypothetical protein [Gammaproteobacteria bacterium]
MDAYLSWKYLHILMFVFWVGTDMGVFISCKKSTDPNVPIDARFMLLHMALRIELLPRTMWKAALPLGVMLSHELGLLQISAGGLAAVWTFSLAWLALSLYSAWHYDKPIGHRLTKYNNIVTSVVGVTLIALAVTSYAGNGPFAADATWLHWKVGIYGLINLMIVAMLFVFDPMGIEFGKLAVEGSTPETEANISAIMNRAAVTIWTTYVLIFVVGFIATTKII